MKIFELVKFSFDFENIPVDIRDQIQMIYNDPEILSDEAKATLDNQRIARVGDKKAEEQFEKARQNDRIGFDTILTAHNGWRYYFGFNYGS